MGIYLIINLFVLAETQINFNDHPLLTRYRK